MGGDRDSPKGSPTPDEGIDWVEKKRRPRPEPLISTSVEVSRASGLHQTGQHTTFGKSGRFSSKVVNCQGASSPVGNHFYSRNQLYKVKMLETDKECTQGIGVRPGAELPGPPPHVGPGSYNIVSSAAKPRSALDGAEYSTTTMKIKLPSALISKGTISPGPHARYDVRKGLVDHLPRYATQFLDHGHRSGDIEDKDQPGPGHYFDDFKSVAVSASCPNLHGNHEKCMEATGGTKRKVLSTFGMAERFPASTMTSSPVGRYYYAHSSQFTEEDYLKGARSCSFGVSGKTDFTNPLRGHRSDVSPVTYRPQNGYSVALKTSPIDPFASRMNSPVNTFAKLSSTNSGGNRSRGLFKRNADASPGAASSSGNAPRRTSKAPEGAAADSAGVAT